MTDGPRELRVVITVPDHDVAVHFYRDVLGMREQASFSDDNGGRATLLRLGTATLEVGDEAHAAAIDELEVGRRVSGGVRLAFEVKDARAVAAALLGAGATEVAPPVGTPWGSVNARLESPDGQQITIYHNEVYLGPREKHDGPVLLAEPDAGWPRTAEALIADLDDALGDTAVVLEHVGSTSIPGLPAKPIIDLVLGVPDPSDEPAYVPQIEAVGYELHLREPEWHEHRLLKHTDPPVNLHVFAADSGEIERMVGFRDHLRRDPADLDRYRRAKRELAARTWEFVQDYADAKSEVVEDILRRALDGGTAGPAPGTPLRGCFVLVSGPPASGKTTLARQLAPLLGLPLLAKDTLKESMFDSLGASDLEQSRRLGRCAVDALLALARVSGGAVLEAPWYPDRAGELADLPGRVVEVFCRVDRETARRRHAGRRDRHPGHFDGERDHHELWQSVGEPVAGGWPVVEVDAATPIDAAALARELRRVLGDGDDEADA
ncbi:MAG: hypothetical protein QOE01_2175 [Actinomycetota bacterium]|jgi:GrpB-like predicted nucleotidyltransferase (UPF0157 family)/predicted kinase/uncharacterized glyoxalase superfamily protein PhnB|nr:hypothetical protein [Actinomycetota bacterium]